MPHQHKQLPRHRKLTGAEFAARYKAEKNLLLRRYCAAFALWWSCTRPRCRRACACVGEASACLKRALPVVPHGMQWQARRQILAAMPHNIGAPERAARQCMPADFFIETTTRAVADYLARIGKKPLQRPARSGV